jgi:hypothetical protein
MRVVELPPPGAAVWRHSLTAETVALLLMHVNPDLLREEARKIALAMVEIAIDPSRLPTLLDYLESR